MLVFWYLKIYGGFNLFFKVCIKGLWHYLCDEIYSTCYLFVKKMYFYANLNEEQKTGKRAVKFYKSFSK